MYEYRDIDNEGLSNYIRNFDFTNEIFNQPLKNKAKLYTDVLVKAFEQFVPKKIAHIRPDEPPWSNKYTRLL